MRFRCLKHKNLCIVLEPKRQIVEKDGSKKTIPGKQIKFIGGYFDTNDSALIEIINRYRDVYGIEEVKVEKKASKK